MLSADPEVLALSAAAADFMGSVAIREPVGGPADRNQSPGLGCDKVASGLEWPQLGQIH
jgi:hypothetical protein